MVYWRKKIQNMKIRPQGEVMYAKCMGILMKATSITSQYESSSLSAKDRGSNIIDSSLFTDFSNKHGVDEELFGALVQDHEVIVEEARVHIAEYTAMRELADEYIDHSKEDLENDVPLEHSVVTRTMDMAQNAELPHLGSEQVGKAYYLSPWIQYIHGISNNVKENVNIFVWSEGVAKRGENAIVSCLHLDFEMRGLFDVDAKGNHKCMGKFVIICDNCVGQNKNKTVVRYLMWLVESGYCKKVVFLFLVKGHTKNLCDQMYNLLKGKYRSTVRIFGPLNN